MKLEASQMLPTITAEEIADTVEPILMMEYFINFYFSTITRVSYSLTPYEERGRKKIKLENGESISY